MSSTSPTVQGILVEPPPPPKSLAQCTTTTTNTDSEEEEEAVPEVEPATNTVLRTITMEKAVHDRLAWLPSPVSVMLGMPLKAACWESAGKGFRNTAVLGLYMVADPGNVKFGKVSTGKIDGAVMVMRQDEKELLAKHVDALLTYLGTFPATIAEYVGSAEEEDPAEKLKEFAEAKLTPLAFKSFFEDHKKKQVEAGVEGWKDIDSPV